MNLKYFFFQKVMRTEERKTVPKSHCEELAGLILRPFGAETESVKSMDCVRKQAPGEVTDNVVVLCCCWSKLKSR